MLRSFRVLTQTYANLNCEVWSAYTRNSSMVPIRMIGSIQWQLRYQYFVNYSSVVALKNRLHLPNYLPGGMYRDRYSVTDTRHTLLYTCTGVLVVHDTGAYHEGVLSTTSSCSTGGYGVTLNQLHHSVCYFYFCC
jgi:hypothetical protein